MMVRNSRASSLPCLQVQYSYLGLPGTFQATVSGQKKKSVCKGLGAYCAPPETAKVVVE